MQTVKFQTSDGAYEEFCIEEQTTIGGISYLLVSQSTEEGDLAYLLKDVSPKDSTEAVYEFVEDDEEYKAVSRVFDEMLEDVDLEG